MAVPAPTPPGRHSRERGNPGRRSPTQLAAITAIQPPTGRRLQALYLLLGFCAGLPLYMFSAVLAARLANHGVGIVLIGFFGWVQLVPTFKFVWAPLLDARAIPGLARWFGQRLGWIVLAQIGIVGALGAMALVAGDGDLRLTALGAVLLALWTATLEIAADGWRVELAPTAAEQAPLVAANLWGYRGAVVAAGSGALILADRAGWSAAYLAVAAIAALPPVLLTVWFRPRPAAYGALAQGAAIAAAIVGGVAAIVAVLGAAALALARAAGVGAQSDMTRAVLGIALVPFAALALALPRIRRLAPDARVLTSPVIGPYLDVFWRLGYRALPVLAFVSFYRMGDVLTLALAKPLAIAAHYDLTALGLADGAVALPASIAGVALGALLAARLPLAWALAIGAALSALGNWIFAWLWWQPKSAGALYLATGLDQFAHAAESAVFVVYLSLLVNPRHPAAQYALLSGFAFLLPRLIAGSAGNLQQWLGYDGFFMLSGTLSLAAAGLLPFVTRLHRFDGNQRLR